MIMSPKFPNEENTIQLLGNTGLQFMALGYCCKVKALTYLLCVFSLELPCIPVHASQLSSPLRAH